jgi:SAM-dependent methyltransferase
LIPPTKDVEYVGKDLEAMSFAANYHKWILEEFRSYLGKRIVEVGAGSGSFSRMILDERPESLTVIEPSGMFDLLRENLSSIATETLITYHNSLFETVRDQIATGAPDSVLYVNVLEHIEDDSRELAMVHDVLVPGGRCFIFVPALQSLYGPFDEKIGHFRRYSKAGIDEKCRAAGFRMVKSKYFDMPGILPWFVKYKLLRSDSLEPGAVTLYDRVAVPIVRAAEKVIPVPIGKNILVVAEK